MTLTEAVEDGVRVLRRADGATAWRSDCLYCQRVATVRDPEAGDYPHHESRCEKPIPVKHCGCASVCWPPRH